MTNRARIFMIVVSISSAINVLPAQWVQTNGPFGGGINSFLVSGSTLFTSNSTNIFCSTDDGITWNQVTTNVPASSFAKIGMNLFAASNGGGVFLSTDNGSSWKAVNAGLTDLYVKILLVSGTNLFAGTERSGIFLSTNVGTSWAAASSGLSDPGVITLKLYGTNLFAGTNSGVFRSTDNGGTWAAANSGLPATSNGVFSFCSSGSYLFCVIDGKGIFRSADSGASWTPSSFGLPSPPWNLHEIFAIDTSVFVNVTEGIFRSTDYGASWNRMNFPFQQVYCFFADDPYLFVGGSDGVYRSTNNGVTWTQMNQGLTVPVKCATRTGTKLYTGTRSGGVFLTTDDGAHWTHLADCTGYVDGIAATDTTIFTSNSGSSGHGPDGNVFFSTDNGQSWRNVNSNLTTTNVPALVVSGNFVFAGTLGAGVFRTSNNGTSWTQVNSGLTNYTVWALGASDSVIFAGTMDGLFRSSDNGASWTKTSCKFSSSCSIGANGENVFVRTQGGIWVSTDNGTTWTLVPGESGNKFNDFSLSKNDALAATSFSSSEITSLTANHDFLFAGTLRSVWRIPISKITSVQMPDQRVPTAFHLAQNFPNPFNPSTVIGYELPKGSLVSLKVFDVLGRQIETLVREHQNAGSYLVTFNAGYLPSGVYFYRLQAGSFALTKKLILLR